MILVGQLTLNNLCQRRDNNGSPAYLLMLEHLVLQCHASSKRETHTVGSFPQVTRLGTLKVLPCATATMCAPQAHDGLDVPATA